MQKLRNYVYYKIWVRLRFADVIVKRYLQWFGVGAFARLLKITKPKAQFVFTPDPAIVVNGIVLTYEVSKRGNVLGMDVRGVWEPGDLAFILHAMKDGGAFYDVGANIGWFSLNVAVHCPSATIVAFEPYDAALRKHIALNNIPASRIHIYGCALGSENSMICMTEGLLAGNHIAKTGRPFSVRALDDIVVEQRLPDPKVVKIDVEGFEYEVLKGAEQLLRRTRPLLLCELAGLGEDETQAVKFLERLGYRVQQIGNREELSNTIFAPVVF